MNLKRAFTSFVLIGSGIVATACGAQPSGSDLAGEDAPTKTEDQTAKKKPKIPAATTPQSTPPPPSNATGPVRAAPVLSLVVPASLPANSPQTSVTLHGSGLAAGAMVDIAGTRVQATADGESRLTFQLPVDKLRNAGPLALTVVLGTVNSNSISIIVTSAAAATVTSVSPASTTARPSTSNTGASLNIQVAGSGFTATSQISFNAQSLQTTFGSATTLSAQVPTTQLRTPGTYNIVVTDSGRVSTPVSFEVKPDTVGGTGGTMGRPCSDFSLQPGYCLTTGTNSGTYCDANNRAYRDYNKCPYGTGAGTGYLTCADAGVTGYGCVSTGQYAGMLCSNGYLYQDAACQASYGAAGTTGTRCQVSCDTAGVMPTGCVASGTYRGNYCASDGCVYNGTAYGCDVYNGTGTGTGGGVSCRGATCADYALSTFECTETNSGIGQCSTDGCMYLGCE